MNKQSGFSLIEVLIASVLLFGLIYICLSSIQSQSSQIDSSINGKYLSVLVNNLIVDIAKNNGHCTISGDASVKPIADCYRLHPDVGLYLTKIGFNLSNSTLNNTSTIDLHQANILVITMVPASSHIHSHSLYTMANTVLSNLSQHALSCLSAQVDQPFANKTGSTANLILQFNLNPGCGT
jgi:hypothetical protein